MGRETSRRRRPTIALVALGALALTACGSDDSAAGSTEAFCDGINTLADSGDATDEGQDLATFRSIAEVAPEEISDEMDQLVEAFERLQTFDPQTATEDEMAEFLTLAEGLDGASTTVEEFARDNCPDLPTGFFGDE